MCVCVCIYYIVYLIDESRDELARRGIVRGRNRATCPVSRPAAFKLPEIIGFFCFLVIPQCPGSSVSGICTHKPLHPPPPPFPCFTPHRPLPPNSRERFHVIFWRGRGLFGIYAIVYIPKRGIKTGRETDEKTGKRINAIRARRIAVASEHTSRTVTSALSYILYIYMFEYLPVHYNGIYSYWDYTKEEYIRVGGS